MFGQLIFADIPFADHGDVPTLDDGWHLVDKRPCNEPDWQKKEVFCRDFDKQESPATNWNSVK